jgi:tetratricopeptide (TPR) repeat protein
MFKALCVVLISIDRYSLVIPVPVQSMTTFRFHPLVLSWARDRMTTEEYSFYQAAAIRLLVCGITIGDDLYLSEYLSSHITELDSIFDSLHVNDRAAISVILRAERKHDRFRTIWNRIHHEVEAVHGENHIRTNRVALEIAAIALYPVTNENCEKAKTMMEGVVISREKILGNDHLENAEARLALSCILCECRQRERAAELQKCILRDQIKTLGLCHLDTANTLMELSTTTLLLPNYRSTRQHIIIAAASIRTKLLGRSAQRTILSLQDLASCHALLHHYAESESLRTEIQELQQTIHPDQHLADVGSMAILASLYDTQGWYKEAEQLRRWELETRRHLQGERNSQTLMTMSWLGHALFQQKRYEEAEQVYAESLERRRQLHGVHHLATLNAMSWSARTLYAQSRYAEAERLWKEQWGIFQVLLGNKHKSTLVSMNSVAKAYVKQGKYTEAEALLTEELELRRELHGNGHPETFDSIHWLGQTLFSQGRYEDAEKLWKEEVEGRQSQGSSGEVELTARVHHHLALLYRQTRRYEEAKEAAEQAVRIREPLGSDEAALLESSQLLASIKEHITTTHPQTSSQSALEEKTAPIQAASVTHHKRPIQAAADGGTSSDGDDISAPEADEDMRSVHQSETAGPVASGSARPIRPFTMRELFGGRPNAWSMF